MDRESVITLAWMVGLIFVIYSVTVYSIVHLLVLGRSVMPKRQHEEDPKIVSRW